MIKDLIGLSLRRVTLFFLSWGLERYVDFLHQVFVHSWVVALLILIFFLLFAR